MHGLDPQPGKQMLFPTDAGTNAGAFKRGSKCQMGVESRRMP